MLDNVFLRAGLGSVADKHNEITGRQSGEEENSWMALGNCVKMEKAIVIVRESGHFSK